jgi:hypothetical protein
MREPVYRCGDCGKRARWYVTSGPMEVCWNHKRHYEAQGETCGPLAPPYTRRVAASGIPDKAGNE